MTETQNFLLAKYRPQDQISGFLSYYKNIIGNTYWRKDPNADPENPEIFWNQIQDYANNKITILNKYVEQIVEIVNEGETSIATVKTIMSTELENPFNINTILEITTNFMQQFI